MEPMDVFSTIGRKVVMPASAEEASLIGRHWNAMRGVLLGKPGARTQLATFAKYTIAGFRFETDADVVLVEGLRGELSPDSIYVQGS